MTVKEIAEAVGKTDRAVQKWVKNTSEKSSAVSEKSSASSPSNPADYTLSEVIEIIRAGAGDSIADTFATNAQEQSKPERKKKQALSGAMLREMRMIYGAEGAASRIDQYMGFSSHENIEVYPVAANLGRISKQAYAVEMKYRRKKRAQQIEDNRSPELFDGGDAP